MANARAKEDGDMSLVQTHKFEAVQEMLGSIPVSPEPPAPNDTNDTNLPPDPAPVDEEPDEPQFPDLEEPIATELTEPLSPTSDRSALDRAKQIREELEKSGF